MKTKIRNYAIAGLLAGFLATATGAQAGEWVPGVFSVQRPQLLAAGASPASTASLPGLPSAKADESFSAEAVTNCSVTGTPGNPAKSGQYVHKETLICRAECLGARPQEPARCAYKEGNATASSRGYKF